MYTSSNEDIAEIQEKSLKENPQVFANAHQEHNDDAARERQERLKARVFQREVASSSAAAAAATTSNHTEVQPRRQQPLVSQPSSSRVQTALSDKMSSDMTLDTMMVKILGKIYPPAILTNELRELIAQLPVAINAERAARETLVAQLRNQINNANHGNDAEIHKLKTEKGQLVADIKRLEAGFRQRKIPMPNIYTPRAILDGPSAPHPVNNYTVAAPAGKPAAAGSSVSTSTSGAIRSETAQQQITKTGANVLPVTNLQPRFQDRFVSPPEDPRPQCYTASATGFFYESSQSGNVFQGNERQVIHPSRMGQMDGPIVTKLFNPALAARVAGALGEQAAGTPPSGLSSGQVGAAQQDTDPSSQRSALPNEMWQSRFGGLRSTASSQGSQPSASNVVASATTSSTQDPRLVGRANATAAGKKRAASPSKHGDAGKKAKVDLVDVNRNPDASRDGAMIASVAENRRLYIENLPYATTKADLEDFFNGYSVENITIAINAGIAKPDGLAFVDISTSRAAKRAVEELNGTTFLCCKVSVQLASQPEAGSNSREHHRGAMEGKTKTISELNEDIERTQERYNEAKQYREGFRVAASNDS